jgi:hypothetical protein
VWATRISFLDVLSEVPPFSRGTARGLFSINLPLFVKCSVNFYKLVFADNMFSGGRAVATGCVWGV